TDAHLWNRARAACRCRCGRRCAARGYQAGDRRQTHPAHPAKAAISAVAVRTGGPTSLTSVIQSHQPTPLSPEGTQISGHCTTYSTCVSYIPRTEVLSSAARPALRALCALALIIHAGQAAPSSPGRASPVPVPAIAAVAGVALRLGPRELTRS